MERNAKEHALEVKDPAKRTVLVSEVGAFAAIVENHHQNEPKGLAKLINPVRDPKLKAP